jgi:antitoxin MazE
MKVKIAKWGNSLGLRLPKAAVEAAGLKSGAEVEVIVEGRDLRLSQVAKIPYYRLEDLIAEMDRLGPENRPKLEDWSAIEAPWPDDDWSDIAPTDKEMGVKNAGRHRRKRA